MTRRLAMLLVATALPGAALAVEGASLRVETYSPITAPLSYRDFAWPITLSLANRSLSVRATAEYGLAKVTGNRNAMAESFAGFGLTFGTQSLVDGSNLFGSAQALVITSATPGRRSNSRRYQWIA